MQRVLFTIASDDRTGLEWNRRQNARNGPQGARKGFSYKTYIDSRIRSRRRSTCHTSKERDIMAKKRTSKKRVGAWKIKRVGENQLAITIPTGMTIRNDAPVTVEDLLSGIANYMAAKKGLPVTCCSANLMVV
jgi:hypothetical protein